MRNECYMGRSLHLSATRRQAEYVRITIKWGRSQPRKPQIGVCVNPDRTLRKALAGLACHNHQDVVPECTLGRVYLGRANVEFGRREA